VGEPVSEDKQDFEGYAIATWIQQLRIILQLESLRIPDKNSMISMYQQLTSVSYSC